MNFKQRLKFYLFGFLLGMMVLATVLNKKGCKGVNTLKTEELSYQTWNITEPMRCKIRCMGFAADSLFIQDIRNATVNYSESDIHATPCGKYVIESSAKSAASYTLLVADCGTAANLLDIKTNTPCDCK
ncbi:MAG: hypothetical protein JST67_04420 [Bacteroidetes bacterium]|nr:hypothetical protein [Bacteroidota bacterium]